MPGVTKEQIEKAKEWDLLSYLETYEPQELKRCGHNEYCTRTHDSLKISHGKWCWHSRGFGGRTALIAIIFPWAAPVPVPCSNSCVTIQQSRKSAYVWIMMRRD